MTGRVAVIGAGNIGQRHLRILRSIADSIPVIVSRRPSVRAELASEGFEVAMSIREAVNAGVTQCVVATETARHTEDACAALEAGCDVLVEKPLGVDLDDAQKSGRAATAYKHSVHVACVLRFANSLTRFRSLLPRIGPVHSVHVACQSYLPEWRTGRPFKEYYSAQAGGGVLRDLVHEIDYTGWIFGWPLAIQARLRNLGWLGIVEEEAAELLWEIPGGPTVNMSLDFLTRPARRTMIALGRQGTLEWDGIRGTTTLNSLDGADVQTTNEAMDEILSAQDRAFIESRSDPRLATLDQALKALALCDAARRASQSGRIERVQYL